MPNEVNNRLIQFADDTKIWKIIRSINDRDSLQNDLNSLTKWSKKWLLRFNPKKCKVLHLGHNNPKFKYTMDEQVLEETFMEKDLGVLISNDLKCGEQCNKSAKKAMRVLGMIKRSFKHLDEESLKLLYCSFVRPHLEYCIQAWSPYFKKDIDTLERVQRRATKLIPRFKKLSYEERLERLKLIPLEQRRLRGDLIETYKILSNKVDVNRKIFFQLADTVNLRGNSMKLYKQRSRLIARQNFFSQRVVDFWNDLPNYTVQAPSVNSFKARLDKHWSLKKWNDIKAQGR